MLAVLFLCSFLDRTNVGNAKIYGLETDIHITDYQYSVGLTVFYATYIASEIPSNLVLKRVSPRVWLPLLTFVWGVFTLCLGFVRSFGAFAAVRALLGIAEGGLLPGMVLYLSFFYKRSEMALRIGLFYTAASLSGAFGGLLARGLYAIGNRGGVKGWGWIFIIEGLLTSLCGVIAYFVLPNNLESCTSLTAEEKAYARRRLLVEKPVQLDGTVQEDKIERFAWSEVIRGILNIQVWLTASAYFAILSGLYSFGLFLPTIINATGFTKSANETQLWSVIPYAVAAVVTVAVAFISDRMKLRGVIMLFSLPLAIVGYAVIANISAKQARVKYGMTFLMATGMYASVPCILVWNSNNSAGHYKRATTTALQLAIANAGGFIATFIYPTKEGPQFHRGHTVILGLLVYAWFAIAANVAVCWWTNKQKAAGKYERFRGVGDDRDPEFKMIL